jgi:hypothetical protein
MTPALALPARRVLRVEGPDAPAFLHALLTQSVEDMAAGDCVYAGLLTPQGKVITDLFVWRTATDAYLLDVPATAFDALTKKLTLYRLRSQVSLSDASDAWRAAASLSGPADMPTAMEALEPRFRNGEFGYRILAPADAASSLRSDDRSYEVKRLELGVPDLARDAQPEEVFALEALFDELNGVDFHKGCFPGQENVSRMKRRATTRKKFCPVMFTGPAPAPGAAIMAGTATLGDIRTGREDRALALLRLDRALEAQAAGQTLSADAIPLALAPPSWLILPPLGEA